MTVLPVYIVLDTSASTIGSIYDLNIAALSMVDAFTLQPLLGETVWVSIVTFSNNAKVLVPLLPGRELKIPLITPGGGTSYGSAFRLLRKIIPSDIKRVRSTGNRVLRPVMFFISDGPPTDEWTRALEELNSPDFKEHPTIIAFGIGSADPEIIRKVGMSGGAFASSVRLPQESDYYSFFSQMRKMLTSTISSSVSSGEAAIPSPQRVFTTPIDEEWHSIL